MFLHRIVTNRFTKLGRLNWYTDFLSLIIYYRID